MKSDAIKMAECPLQFGSRSATTDGWVPATVAPADVVPGDSCVQLRRTSVPVRVEPTAAAPAGTGRKPIHRTMTSDFTRPTTDSKAVVSTSNQRAVTVETSTRVARPPQCRPEGVGAWV